MNNNSLESTNEERDLGVIVDDLLKFHRHTAAAVRKANSVLGIIKKGFTTLDKVTLPLLYKSMVRHHLEHGNVIWGPNNGRKAPKEGNKINTNHMAPTLRGENESFKVTITNA